MSLILKNIPMYDIGDIKKLKLFDKLVIWTSKNKIHIKDLDKPDEHGTILFLKDMIDFHRKTESTKTYQPIGVLDFKKTILKIAKNPLEFISPLLEMKDLVRVVNFDEDDLEHLQVEIFPDKTTFFSLFNRKGKEYSIPKEKMEILNRREKCKWKECKDKQFQLGFVFDDKQTVGFISELENGGHAFVTLNDKTNSIMESLEKSWMQLDPPSWNQKDQS